MDAVPGVHVDVKDKIRLLYAIGTSVAEVKNTDVELTGLILQLNEVIVLKGDEVVDERRLLIGLLESGYSRVLGFINRDL